MTISEYEEKLEFRIRSGIDRFQALQDEVKDCDLKRLDKRLPELVGICAQVEADRWMLGALRTPDPKRALLDRVREIGDHLDWKNARELIWQAKLHAAQRLGKEVVSLHTGTHRGHAAKPERGQPS